MSDSPSLTLHVLPASHPSKAAEAALAIKGLEFERVELVPGEHTEVLAETYGEGRTTVPGMLVGGEPVHGSRAIMARLEELAPEPALYPEAIAAEVREAERWGDEELQDLGRRLPFGALHFRPEMLGTIAGAEPLDPAGTDFAMRYIHGAWKYHGITAERLAEDLASLPAKLDHVDELISAGTIGGERPNAADLQIGCTIRVFTLIGDLEPLLSDRPLERIGLDNFPDYAGEIPAGAFPEGWVPERAPQTSPAAT